MYTPSRAAPGRGVLLSGGLARPDARIAPLSGLLIGFVEELLTRGATVRLLRRGGASERMVVALFLVRGRATDPR